MANRDYDRAREAVLAKVAKADFENMSQVAYGRWVDGLPVVEFIALLDLHREGLQRQNVERAKKQLTKTLRKQVGKISPDEPWVVYTGDGESPVPDDTIVRVLFPDGGESGPNPAHMFAWNPYPGHDQTLAYLVVQADASAPPRGEKL